MNEDDDGPTEQLGMFCSLVEPFTHSTEESMKMRQDAFRSADSDGSGHCSLAQLEGYILTMLEGAYPKKQEDCPTTGRELHDLYRPCYGLAFSSVKATKADSGEMPEGATVVVNVGEFRLFCAYVCMYCSLFDAFNKIDGGGGKQGVKDRKVDLGEWVKRYRNVSGYPFAALDSATTDDEAKAMFGRMDSSNAGAVTFEGFCSFVVEAELAAGTEMGETLKPDNSTGAGGPVLSENYNHYGMVDANPGAKPKPELKSSKGEGSNGPVLSENYNHYGMVDANPGAKPKPELKSSQGEGSDGPVLSENYNHYGMVDANPGAKPKPELKSSASTRGAAHSADSVESLLAWAADVAAKFPNNLCAKHLVRLGQSGEVAAHAEQLPQLARCTRSGLENPDSGLGCYAMEPADFEALGWFFGPVCDDYHGGSSSVHASSWSLEGMPGVPKASSGLDLRTVGVTEPLSIRVRVGRNLDSFPLPGAMAKTDRIKFESTMLAAFAKLTANEAYGGQVFSLTPHTEWKAVTGDEMNPNLISSDKYQELVDSHVMFKDMDADPYLKSAGISGDWPCGRGCYQSADGGFIIWFGEEDQLRIMCMGKGFLLTEIFDRLNAALQMVETIEGIKFATSSKYGFVTSCPSNLGTGMRASVDLKVPNLTSDGSGFTVKAVAKQLGLSVRGSGGEHTAFGEGGSVDISPSARLYVSEAGIIVKLYNGIKVLLEMEAAAGLLRAGSEAQSVSFGLTLSSKASADLNEAMTTGLAHATAAALGVSPADVRVVSAKTEDATVDIAVRTDDVQATSAKVADAKTFGAAIASAGYGACSVGAPVAKEGWMDAAQTLPAAAAYSTPSEFSAQPTPAEFSKQLASVIDQLTVIMAKMEGKDELKELFNNLDKNQDGRVSGQEWGKAVKSNQELLSKYFGGSSLKEIGSAFKRLDSDKDGMLTWSEFEVALDEWAEGTANVEVLAMAMVSDDGRSELRELFNKMDKDGNGKVSGKEWGKAVGANRELLAKYFGGSTLVEIGSAFKRLDTDNSGTLTWDEFEAALAQWDDSTVGVHCLASIMEEDESKAELKALFDKLDKDGDGKVSGQEWGRSVAGDKDVMAKYFGGSTLKEIGSAFRRLDTDRSGALTWDEFEAALFQWDAPSAVGVNLLASIMEEDETKAELKALFDKLDKDGDGKVTSKEWGRSVAGDKDVMAKFFGGSTLKEIGSAFRRLDTDNNGALTWDEFEAALVQWDSSSSAAGVNRLALILEEDETKAELQTLFEKLDKDGDGKVTSKEWGRSVAGDKDVMAKFFGGSSLKEIGSAFRKIDTDKSGALSWDEFVAALEAHKRSNAPPTEEPVTADAKSKKDKPAAHAKSPGRESSRGRPPKPSRKKSEAKDPLNPYSKEARASSLPRANTPSKPVHGGRVSSISRPKSRSVSRPSGAPTAFTAYDSSRFKEERDAKDRAIMKARIEAMKETRREDSRMRRDQENRQEREHLAHMREQSLMAQRMKEERDKNERRAYRASKDADLESRREQKRLMEAKRLQSEREHLDHMRSQSALKSSMRDETAKRERRETTLRQQSLHASRKEMSEAMKNQSKLKEEEHLKHKREESRVASELKAARDAKDAAIKKQMIEANRESRLAAKAQAELEVANSNREILEMNKRLAESKEQTRSMQAQREKVEKNQARLGATVMAGSGSSLDGN
jgi:creatine kinase